MIPISLNEENAEGIIKGVDVVDGLDQIEPRYVLNRTCVKLDIPYIFGAAIETFGNLSTILPGKTQCLECFMPDLTDLKLPTCGVVGVHPSISCIISSLQVSEAVKIILGKEPSLTNKLLFCDLRRLSFEELYISRMEKCPICGVKEALTPIKTRKLVETICGRRGHPAFVITPKKNLELNMDRLNKILEERGYHSKIKAQLGATFDINDNVTISTMSSGIAILEGFKDESEVLSIYKKTIVDDLGVYRPDIK